MLTVDNQVKELSERQIDIIRTTIQLIAEEGVHNFSIRKLAKRVGVTEPAVYRHFSSKDDLMINLATYIVRNWHEQLDHLKIQALRFVDRAESIFREVMGYLDENREFAKTLMSTNLFAADSGMTSILLELKNEGLHRFSELLAEGQAAGQVRADVDAASVTSVFFGSVWWVVSDWITTDFDGDLLERWKAIWRVLVRLLDAR